MNIDISKFAPIGTKFCEGKCDRIPVRDKEGTKVVCLACKRVVMDIKTRLGV